MLSNQGKISHSKISRRHFLQMVGVAGAGTVLAACVAPAAPTTAGGTTSGSTTAGSPLLVWDCPNSAADMPMLNDRDKMFKEAYPEDALSKLWWWPPQSGSVLKLRSDYAAKLVEAWKEKA